MSVREAVHRDPIWRDRGAGSGAAWSLQDRAGSTVAQTTPTGGVSDLVSYSGFGV